MGRISIINRQHKFPKITSKTKTGWETDASILNVQLDIIAV
jgi:hypothetical protein